MTDLQRYINDPSKVTTGSIRELIDNMTRLWPEDIETNPIGVDMRYVPRDADGDIGAYARIYWRDSALTVIATQDRGSEEWTVNGESSFIHTIDRLGLPTGEDGEVMMISMSPDNVEHLDDIVKLFGLDKDEETHKQFIDSVSNLMVETIVGDIDHCTLQDDLQLVQALARRRNAGGLSREENEQLDQVRERLHMRARAATKAQDLPNSDRIADLIARQLADQLGKGTDDGDLNTGFYL